MRLLKHFIVCFDRWRKLTDAAKMTVIPGLGEEWATKVSLTTAFVGDHGEGKTQEIAHLKIKHRPHSLCFIQI